VFIYLSVCCALFIVITINVSKTAFFVMWLNPNFKFRPKKDPNFNAILQQRGIHAG